MRSLMIFAALLLAFSCSKKGPKACDLSVPTQSAPDNGNLSYSVTLIGNGSVSSITYQDPTGPVTVSNPQLPFSISFGIVKGGTMAISVTGKVEEGSGLQAGYLYLDLIGANPVNVASSCTF